MEKSGETRFSGRGKFPPYPSWVLVAGLIIKLTQDRLTGEKETSLISGPGGPIEMGPKKWQKQATFILFGQ